MLASHDPIVSKHLKKLADWAKAHPKKAAEEKYKLEVSQMPAGKKQPEKQPVRASMTSNNLSEQKSLWGIEAKVDQMRTLGMEAKPDDVPHISFDVDPKTGVKRQSEATLNGRGLLVRAQSQADDNAEAQKETTPAKPPTNNVDPFALSNRVPDNKHLKDVSRRIREGSPFQALSKKAGSAHKRQNAGKDQKDERWEGGGDRLAQRRAESQKLQEQNKANREARKAQEEARVQRRTEERDPDNPINRVKLPKQDGQGWQGEAMTKE